MNKGMKLSQTIFYLILNGTTEGFTVLKGYENFTDLGITRVHERHLIKLGLLKLDGLRPSLTEKGIKYLENAFPDLEKPCFMALMRTSQNPLKGE
jgi:hypothetical protein